MSDISQRDSLAEQLRTVPVFAGLDDDTLARIARSAIWRAYAPGEMVFLEGDAGSGLHYLAYGWLKAVRSSLEGREQVLRFIGPGETFNEIGAFTSHPNPATAIALENAGIWLLDRQALVQLLRTHPDLAQRLLENMANRVVELANLIADLSLRTVTGRLARLLLDEATGDVFPLPRWRTQTELAGRLGTVADVVQRALRTLQSEGAIDVQRSEIRICSRERLLSHAA